LKLFFVSSNSHKFQEIQLILREYHIPISFYQTELPEIQSESIEKIALFSAKTAFSEINQPLFTEDTGLFVEALNGFPGPYSSYVFKTIGNRGVLHLLDGESNRTAVFKTAIALIISNTESMTFLGETKGKIALSERGTKGWGYDPIFIPLEGDGRTYGEMKIEEKNQLSHRRKALQLLSKFLSNQYPHITQGGSV